MIQIPNGRFEFAIAYRDVEIDHGLTLHVYGPTKDAAREEVLRFDCFAKQPHYHLGWSYRKAPFIPIDAADPFAWTLTQLQEHMSDLLQRAAAQPMNEDELAQLQTTLYTVEQHGRELLAAE